LLRRAKLSPLDMSLNNLRNHENSCKKDLKNSYIPGVGLAVIFIEKENKFVRFHAFQSIFFWVAAFAIYSMTYFLRILLVGFFLIPLVNVAITVLWFYLTWQAYNKVEFELPIIGKLAREQVEK